MKNQRKFKLLLILLLVTILIVMCACEKNPIQGQTEKVDTSINEEALFRIACISDLHSRDKNLKDQKLRGVVQDTLNAYSKMDIDVLIMGGDLASGTIINEEKNDNLLNKFNNLASAVTSNVLYLTGNHDYSTAHNLYPSSWFPTTKYLYYKYNSADYFNKFMKDKINGLISTHLEYYDNRGHKNKAQTEYVLGYHYKLDKYHFIGLNTHPGDLIGDKQRTNYTLTKDTIDYALNELKSIDKSERVFLLCHYPLNDSNNLRKDKGINNEMSEYFKNGLIEYENVIYLYGHDHKNGKDKDNNATNCYIKEQTSERVTQYYKQNNEKSFVSCFMGSMAYENTPLEPNTAKFDPTIAQGLVVEIFENKITLQMKNYGVMNGKEFNIKPFVIDF